MPPSLLLLVLFSLSPLIIAQPPGGLTFETCQSDLGCTQPRRCLDTLSFRRCKTPSRDSTCVCVPASFTPCESSSTCIEGEVCARELETPFVCTSAIIAVPPNGPITAEEAAEKPFIANCPRPKSSNRNTIQPLLRMPKDPPSEPPFPIPPDAPPGGPPGFPPDTAPDAPTFQPVPGSPPPPPPDLADPKRNGLNRDICRPGTCARGLSCVTIDTTVSAGPPTGGGRNGVQKFRCCVDEDLFCLCHPRDTRPVCQSTADCSRRELCAKTPVSPPTCTSRDTFESMTSGQRRRVVIFEGEQRGQPGKPVPLVERPTPSPDTIEETPQETFDEIIKATVTPEVASKPVDESPSTAVASPSVESTSLPATPVAPNNPSPEAEAQEVDGICVDATALRDLDRSDVVFSHDRHARVLCDINGSCATAGHIIWFNGKVMMMKSYCNFAGCEEKVIKVNSPRYRRGMMVKSRTEGLGYTTFAARYGTRVEEGVLAGVIRMGL